MSDLLADVVDDLEVARSRLTDSDAEQRMSVNDWIERVRVGTQSAHKAARAGLLAEEYQAWLEVAAAAVGRAEFVLSVWKEQSNG